MSAEPPSIDSRADLSSKADRLLAYLSERLQTEGSFYAKSRYIADDIDLSAKEIGASMRQLQHAPVPVQIEKWGYTNGTTWLISAP